MEESDLTADLIMDIATEIREGSYPRAACARRHISQVTFNRWMDTGNELIMRRDSGVDLDGLSKLEWFCVGFATEVNQAYADAEWMMLKWAKDLAASGRSTWTMPFTWLERCRPGWQRRDQMQPEASTDAELAKLTKQFEAFDGKREKAL